jgi:hypothetical protein
MAWIRNPAPYNLQTLSVVGQLNLSGAVVLKGNSVFADSTVDPTFQFYDTTGTTTRTTFGLQVQPRFANTWVTSANTTDQLTFARYPGGFVHVCGIVSNATAANRADATYAFDLGATTFAQTFVPKAEIHVLADGPDRANSQQPVFVIGNDAAGTVRCYNLDIVAANSDYRLNAVYNRWTIPGKYENTGGGPK